MADRWDDNPNNRRLVDDIKRELARGTGYNKAVARVLLRYSQTGIRKPLPRTLEIARAQAKQERTVEGTQKRSATRQANLERARIEQRRLQGEAIPAELPEAIIYQNPSQRTGQTPYRRVDVDMVDRRTGERFARSIFLPLIGSPNPTALRGLIFAAILQNEGRDVSTDEQALWESLRISGTDEIILR